MPKVSKIKTIINDLGIDEKFTTPLKMPKDYKFTKVKNRIPPLQDYNFMADLLMLPEDKKGFKYLLVVCDLWSDEVDFEPIKNKDSVTVLNALKKIFKRPYLNLPKGSIATDSGSEFKGVFHKYLYDNNVYHKVALAGRHKQQSVVERMNRTLGRVLNGYMNKKETETGKIYKEWTDILPRLRVLLNVKKKPDENPFTKKYPDEKILLKPSKFKVGDFVHRRLEEPKNALGHKQPTKNFREGDYRFDTVAKKILDVLPYGDQYKYILDGVKNVAYSEFELMKSDQQVSKYEIKKIIGEKKIKNKIYYLVWWTGYKKAEATWSDKSTLLEDGAKDYIDEYLKSKK